MKLLDYLRLAYQDNGENCRCECISCGGDDTLEIATATPHAFQCWKCHWSGNAFTLLDLWYSQLPDLSPQQAEELASWKPGTAPDAYIDSWVKPSPGGYVWPCYDEKGHLNAIYRYSREQNIWYSSPKPCSYPLLGADTLLQTGYLWIAEGHWDYAAFLPHCPEDATVLGSCGSSLAARFLPLLTGRDVVLLFDNDEAGKEGVRRVASRMKQQGDLPSSLYCLDWSSFSEQYPEGFDLRDLINSLEESL